MEGEVKWDEDVSNSAVQKYDKCCALFEMAQRGLVEGAPWILSCVCRRLFRAPCSCAMRAHMAAVVVGRVSDLCVAGCVTHEGPWFRILKVYVETLREAFVRRSYL